MGTNRRNFLKLSAAAPFGIGMLSSDVQARPTQASKAPPAVAQDVKREFRRAWDAYKEIAFGHDLLKPVSGTSTEFFIDDEPLGLTIIESLDTLYFMELDNELEVAVDWIENNLNFDVDGYVSIFEANIRLVGGLLSGYKVTGHPLSL